VKIEGEQRLARRVPYVSIGVKVGRRQLPGVGGGKGKIIKAQHTVKSQK
jgi:hypothetical protein